MSIRTESVTYEDDIICVEAVRASNGNEFYHLELLDKRNGGFHTNKPDFWGNLSFILTLDEDGSEAQRQFSEEFGEENLDTIASFVSQLKEENWFQ